ncbi:unnamed protein product [Coccothraustes coccothraustes]
MVIEYILPCNLECYHNHVITSEGSRGLNQVHFLNLSWTQLKRPREDTNILQKHITNIASLDTTHTPWHKPAAFQLRVTGQLKALTDLD